MVLDQLITLVLEEKPEALLISGDVFDRAVPSPEAVRLLDDTLSRIVLGGSTQCVIIAGNHDSPQRLEFAAQLLSKNNLHIFGTYSTKTRPLTLEDRFGSVFVYPYPFAEPAVIREKLGDQKIRDHDSAFAALCQGIPGGLRTIALAHAFITGGTESESERPLNVGGAGSVSQKRFHPFHYTALGHLHRPQRIKDRPIHYSGSLMKYSFSEASHHKAVNLVEMNESGQCIVQHIPLVPRHDVRCLEGYFSDILTQAEADPHRQDYIKISLLDRGPILDAMNKLRTVYPQILQVERKAPLPGPHQGLTPDMKKNLTDIDLFQAFYEQAMGGPLPQDHQTVLKTIIHEKNTQDQESA